MKLPLHLIVRRTLKRMASSWEPASACGQSKTPRKSADSAPHAQYKSECRPAVRELRAEFCRPTSDGDGLKRLRLRTSDRQSFALKAARRELNSVGKTASPRG